MRRIAPARGGFTLIEIVLAVGVSTVLLLGIYMAITLHFEQLQAGRARATWAQRQRVLIERLRQDLRNVVVTYRPIAAPSLGTEADSLGLTAETNHLIPPGGVLGTPDYIEFVTTGMPNELDYSEGRGVSGEIPVGTLRHVRYELASQSNPVGKYTSGLVRTEWYRVFDRTASGAASTYGRREQLATYVSQIQFRYYDGDWYGEWTPDDVAAPRAVGVLLTLPMREVDLAVDRTVSVRTLEVVVDLPKPPPPPQAGGDMLLPGSELGDPAGDPAADPAGAGP